MSNAFLTDERLGTAPANRQTRPGTYQPGSPPPTQPGPTWPGSVNVDDTDKFTVAGVAWASAMLLAVLIASAVVGWNLVDASPIGVTWPPWLMGAIIGGIAVLGFAYFKPHLAKFLAPLYAVIEGLVVGAVSHVYEFEFDGIVLQAAMLTVGIFVGMLFVYGTGLIKVTDKLRRTVVACTMGVMAVYLFQIVMSVLGVGFQVPFLHDSGPIGIAISLGIVGLAAFNFLLDFDYIERAEKAGAHRDKEWVAALGLLVTTVWLYLELLRLLAKLRD